MTKAATKTTATPRRDKWHEIESRHFGQCVWQQISPNRKLMLEGLTHKSTGDLWIIEKCFDDTIPRQGSGRAWPELSSIVVYRPVAPEITDWDEYEKALR